MKVFRTHTDAVEAIRNEVIQTGDTVNVNGGEYEVTEHGSLLQVVPEITQGQRDTAQEVFEATAEAAGIEAAQDILRRLAESFGLPITEELIQELSDSVAA